MLGLLNTVFTLCKEEGWGLSWGARQWNFWFQEDAALASQEKEPKNERITWSVWASGSTYNPHGPASFLFKSVLPIAGYRQFFSAFILKVPAANTYLNCHWLTPKDETVRFPKINVPQENHSFGQVHIGYESLQLPGGSFNQLYCIGAHYTKPAGFADINARTMKNPTFCDLTRKSNPLQSLLSSRGSGVEIAHSDSSLFRHPRSLAV